MQIGLRANAVNSFQDIGFGYVGNGAQHKPPAVIAYEQTSAAGETSGDLVFGTRGTTSGSTAAVEQVRIRSDGTVDVESVRFTGSQIGINGDTTMIDLGATAGMVTVNGNLKATGDLTLSNTAAVAITHSGTTSLSISSGGFVAVESVQFAGANIGISTDTNLMALTSGVLTVDGKVASTTLETSGAATVGTTLDVSGATTLDSTVSLAAAAATVTHSGATSLTISSTSGFVAVESVQFDGANIGISTDTNLMALTSGVLTVDGKVASTTLDVTGATTLGGTVAVGGAHSDATKELYVNGDIYATGTSTSASDARFKRNITSVTDALEVARKARAVTFSFQTDAFPERRFPKTKQAGVVAQELEAVLPDLVSTDDHGYKGVAYERLGVYALAAVKELDEEVRALRAALDLVRATLEQINDPCPRA